MLFASLFGTTRPLPTKVTRTTISPDGTRYEVTLIRWSEFVKGTRFDVDAEVYLDFDDCETCEDGEGEDWDAEDWDEDAADWVEPLVSAGRTVGAGAAERSMRVVEDLWRAEERRGDVDVWRTRLGEE